MIGLASVAFVIVFGVSMVGCSLSSYTSAYVLFLFFISVVQEAQDNARKSKEWQAGIEFDRRDGV